VRGKNCLLREGPRFSSEIGRAAEKRPPESHVRSVDRSPNGHSGFGELIRVSTHATAVLLDMTRVPK